MQLLIYSQTLFVEVWEWMKKFFPHFIYPCCDLSKTMLVKSGPYSQHGKHEITQRLYLVYSVVDFQMVVSMCLRVPGRTKCVCMSEQPLRDPVSATLRT